MTTFIEKHNFSESLINLTRKMTHQDPGICTSKELWRGYKLRNMSFKEIPKFLSVTQNDIMSLELVLDSLGYDILTRFTNNSAIIPMSENAPFDCEWCQELTILCLAKLSNIQLSVKISEFKANHNVFAFIEVELVDYRSADESDISFYTERFQDFTFLKKVSVDILYGRLRARYKSSLFKNVMNLNVFLRFLEKKNVFKPSNDYCGGKLPKIRSFYLPQITSVEFFDQSFNSFAQWEVMKNITKLNIEKRVLNISGNDLKQSLMGLNHIFSSKIFKTVDYEDFFCLCGNEPFVNSKRETYLVFVNIIQEYFQSNKSKESITNIWFFFNDIIREVDF